MWKESSLFSTSGAGTAGHPHAKSTFVALPHTIYKYYLEMDHIPTTTKFLEETGVHLHDLVLGNGLLGRTPKHKQQKKEIDKLDLSKIKA